MKKLLLSFVMMLTASVAAWADVEVEVDGLRFSVSTGTVPVTAKVIAPAEGVYTGEITIPSSINYNGEDVTVDFINSDAFANATITKVTIPSTVYFIGAQAFYHCESLTEITLPEGLREISVSAFAGCPFTSLTIPGTVTRIDSYGLEDLSSLQKLTFAYSEEKLSMDWSVFNGTNNIIELVIDRDYSFGNNTSISKNTVKKVTFGEHVTKIPENACYDMTLEELNMGANVTAIGVSAFLGCTLPEGYNFPFAQIKEIEEGGFYVCKNLPANIDLTGVEKIEANAFRNSDVQIVKLGSNLTTFGECVFQSCDKLTTLNIPGSINSLTAWWFYGCNALTDVTFDYGSTALTLEDGTFGNATTLTIDRTIDSGSNPISTKVTKVALGSHMNTSSALSSLNLSQCPELTEIELLEGYKELPYDAFKDLATVTTVKLPESLENIGERAFQGTGLTSVTIPGNVRKVNGSAFQDCPNLTSVTIAYSENLTEGGWSFGEGVLLFNGGSIFANAPVTDLVVERPIIINDCPFTAVKRVTFGSHVTEIPNRMFYLNGDGLTLETLTIGENVTEIGDYAFRNCTLPGGCTIPFAQFKKIGYQAFYQCKGLPSEVNLSAIEEIGSNAFEQCTSIESLTIGGGTIGSSAFSGCSNLSSLTLLEGVTEIGSSNFSNLTALTTVNIPSTVKKIGGDAFGGCSNMTIPSDLPEGLEEIGVRAFQNCKKLNVKIPSTVKTLGQSAFSSCESLTEVTIPAGVTGLGMYTFSGCKGLTSITIPGTLLSMSSGEFSNCDNLTEVKIEYGEEPISIHKACFSYTPCTNVYIDRNFSWDESGYSSFDGFKNAENVEFGPHVTAIPENGLLRCSSLKSVTMTDNVTSIGKTAFNQAFTRGENVSIKLSKNLQNIGKQAFYYCAGPQSITLPFALQEIGEEALQSTYQVAEALKDVYVPWIDAPLTLTNDTEDKRTFRYADNQTLWVPGGTLEKYQAADGWKRFQNFDYWSFVVNASVTGKGTLTVANGEEVTDNGTNTELSLTGAKLVEEGAGEAVGGLFVREKDLVLAGKPARGYKLESVTANGEALTVAKDTAIVSSLLADQTLKATFAPIIYNLTIDMAGGVLAEGQSNPTTYTVEDEAITLVNPTRTGYTFEGWTGTDIEGTAMEVTIAANSIGDRSFVATWKPIVYAITYELNKGKLAEGEQNPDTYTIESADFTLVNPTRNGYTFTGWEGTDLTEKTLEVTVTTGHWGDRSYTATWEPNPYKVTFVANGGEGTMEDQDFVFDTAQNLTANAFTRTGYIFAGWNSKADGTGTAYEDMQEVKNLTSKRDKVVKLYAQWTPIHYTVAFDANNGEGTMEAQSFTYDESQALTASTFTREGYTFKGWNSAADGTGEAYTDGQSVKNLSAEDGATVTVYAQWEVIVYTITYDLAGGSVEGNPETYTIESNDITLVNPEQDGHAFLGWTGTGLNEATMSVTIVKGSTGNRSYTATWELNKYDVTIAAAEGGSVEVTTQTPEHGSTLVITVIPDEGYKFQSLTVDGIDVTNEVVDGKYTIESVTGNVSVQASFKKKVRGDVNDDDQVTMADVACIINVIAGGGTEDEKKAADVNGDKVVSVADILAVTAILAGQ